MAYTTIDNAGEYFKTHLYTGNGSTQSITGVGFQPDWVWMKERSQTEAHVLIDSVRGVLKRLRADQNSAEDTLANSLTGFDSDGFSLGSAGEINENTETYVSWNWKAGTSFTNDASSTGIGTIDSAGSVSQTSGFSICTYTGNGSSGATIKHGLSTAPKIIVIKKRNASDSWSMLNTDVDLQKYLAFNSNSGLISDPLFNNTAPTTSVFTVDSDGQVNQDTNTFVAYCFSEVKGYSRFNTYKGNGNSDGAFFYTGFRPSFLLLKHTSSSESWHLYDGKRANLFNPVTGRLQVDSTGAEFTGVNAFDFLSNGFKLRDSNTAYNENGSTYIFMAFAESPFVNSNGVPTNAR